MCKVFYYDQEELEKAREVQRDAIKLNLVPPIVTSLAVSKLDENHEEIEKHIMKSNSFVGNFYQGLASIVGLTSTHFPQNRPLTYEKGGRAGRVTNGNLISGGSTSISDPTYIVIGTGTTPDIWEDYRLESKITNFTDGTTSYDDISYNSATQTLTTKRSKIFINLTTNSYSISECGVEIPWGTNGILTIRDVFTPIQIAQFEGIKIQYVFEFVYP